MMQRFAVSAVAAMVAACVCLSYSPALAATTVNANIAVDTTWTLAKSPYLVTTDIAVNAGVTLTISPGVVVKFNPDCGLTAYGELIADALGGTAITFTSNATVPLAGQWDGVCLRDDGSTTSVLRNCIVQYATTGVSVFRYNSATDPTIRSCTIRKILGHGIQVSRGCAPILGSNIIQDCRGAGVYLESGSKPDFVATSAYTNCRPNGAAFAAPDFHVQEDWTLKAAGGPYYALGNVILDNSCEWILSPGVQIRMARRASFCVYGKLTAIGTSTSNIVFTSAALTPAPGDWTQLLFQDAGSSESRMQYCQVLYGGAETGAIRCNYYGSAANPTISSTKIHRSRHHGVWVSRSQPTLTSLTVTDCTQAALRLEGSAEPVIGGTWTRTGNGHNGTEFAAGFRLEGYYIVYLAGSPYHAAGNLVLPNLAKAVIQPNTKLIFAEGAWFEIYGNLQAVAASGQSIVFSSDNDSSIAAVGSKAFPSAGDWRGLLFQDSGCNLSVLDRCTISYAGYWDKASIWIRYYGSPANPKLTRVSVNQGLGDGVYINRSKPTLDALKVTNCSDRAVALVDEALPVIPTNATFTGNDYDGFAFANNYELPASYRLYNRGVPYMSVGNFTVRGGKTLTIDPGVRFQMEAYTEFNVFGIVKANGTAAAPIKFSGVRAGGPRVWRHMLFQDAGSTTSVLKYCVIENAGCDGHGALWVRRYSTATSPRFENCTVQDNQSTGVLVEGSSTKPTFVNCKVSRNLGWGVWVGSDAQPNFGNTANTVLTDDGRNSLAGNFLGCYYNHTAKTQSAQNCWWGATTTAAINALIVDKADDAWRGVITFAPFLLSAPTASKPPLASGPGELTTMAAMPSPAGGVAIVCALSGAAELQATITNIAGRVVCALPLTSADEGLKSLLWNGKSAFGTKVPTGRYLVKVAAFGNDGTQSSRLAAVNLR